MAATHYDKVAITLHWLMALCIISMLALGFLMGDITPISLRFEVITFHKALGVMLLFLALARLAWRLAHKAPSLPAAMPAIEKRAARAGHVALYGFMILMPLSGWVMSSTSSNKYVITFLGLFEVPLLPIPDTHRQPLHSYAHDAHELIAYGFIALLLVHLAAALKHHFINRDEVLSHMIPRIKRG